MMERGAIGELIPPQGESNGYTWHSDFVDPMTEVIGPDGEVLALFMGEQSIRLERVALFLTTEQS